MCSEKPITLPPLLKTIHKTFLVHYYYTIRKSILQLLLETLGLYQKWRILIVHFSVQLHGSELTRSHIQGRTGSGQQLFDSFSTRVDN